MSDVSPFLLEIRDYVFRLLRDELPRNYIYHNFNHTYETVQAAIEIGKGSNLSEEDLEIVRVAAWFHDTGFTESYENHEEDSKKIARAYLEKKNYPEEKIKKVEDTIGATQMPQEPKDLLGQVLCDADLYNLGQPIYPDKSEILRTEWENVGHKKMSEIEWTEMNIDFLSMHIYFTPYAQSRFYPQKMKNLTALSTKLKEERLKQKKKNEKRALKKEKKKQLKEKEEKSNRPEKGIETMFRITHRNHINLSAIADNKANIMLSINAIIISISVSELLPKFDTDPYMLYPTVLLIFVCTLSMIFATLSTRPKITQGRFTHEDIENRTANLLFFGNFYNMQVKDFEDGFEKMMDDKEYLYGSLTKDFYYLGQVLGKKYKYLSITYTVFMYGIILSLIAFAVAYYNYQPN